MRRPDREAGKTLAPLLGVLAALAMGVAAIAIVLQAQEREKRRAKEHELQQALIENEDLKGRLQELQEAKAKVEDELTHVRKELGDSQTQLAKAVEAQTALSRAMEEKEKEVGRLTQDLSQARSDARSVSAQLAQIQSERESLKRQLAELERSKGDLESQVAELTTRPTVELEKVLVKNDEPAAVDAVSSMGDAPASSDASPANGQVVVVNREYDFIVMNLGKNQGLSVGQEFQITRDSQVLGTVKVEKVYDELSAAAILPDSQKQSIREGDTVRAL